MTVTDAAPLTAVTPTITGTTTVGKTLTAVPGTWGPTDVKLTYQWSANDTNIDGATQNTLDLTPAHAGKTITVTVTGSKPGYATTSKASTPTSKIATANLSTAVPTITGTTTVGKTLTAVPGTWGPTDVKLTYQWSANDTNIDGATQNTLDLTPAHAGKTITVTVTGSKPGYATTSKASTPTSKIATANLSTAVPTITGTTTVGKTLTAVPGTWGPTDVKLTYQWSANDTNIDGATQNTLDLTPAHAGKTITVTVTGSKPGYATTSKASTPTSKIATANLSTAVPTITGTTTVGKTLTAVPGTWGPTDVKLTYQWSANDTNIDGATQNTLDLTPAHAGKTITVTVTGSKPGYATTSKASTPTSKIATANLSTAVPTITGTTTVGKTLTAVPGTWGPTDVKLTYQWSANDTNIDGATQNTLDLTPAHAGKTITVTVTGSKPGYATTSKASTPTSKIATANLSTAVPTITGTTTVGKTLTAVPGTWGPTDVKLTYQWSANDTNIDGATQNTLDLTPAHAGKTITVTVTGSKPGYATTSKASTPTSKIATANLSTAVPTITGTTTVGKTLTAVPGTWGPTDVKLTYQWSANDTNIDGATQNTLDLTPAHAGKTITVTVTGSKPGYATTSKASTPTSKIATANLSTAVPTITGTTTVGKTLTAVPGTWGPTDVKLTYQWSANDTNIDGATQNTLDLTPAHAGKTITVTVTGSKPGYATTSKASTPTSKIATANLSTAVPTITGTTTVGKTLTAVPGTWGPTDVKLTYQWSANDTNIDGATQNTLDLTPAHAGKTITVTVTGSKPGYATTSKASTPTSKIATATVRVTPAAPTSDATTGSYTVPTTSGVTYLVNGSTKAAGTYSSGYTKVTISAVAKDGFTLTGSTSWTFDLSKKSATATEPSVNYSAKTIAIPRVAGVAYYIDGILKATGTHKVTTATTVTAKAAAANYVVAAKTWKYDLRTAVAPAKPVFDAPKNTVKIPTKTGVSYYVNGVKQKAGTYKYTGTGTVTTKTSSSSYKLTGTTSWKFDNRNSVTPTKPTFSASANTVKIPTKTGVTYYINGVKKTAGTRKYTGTGIVTTKTANSSYKLTGTTSWKFDNRNSVTPAKPVFNASKNTVKIPAKTGVTYYINGVKKKAGTHKYTGKVTVTTKASNSSYKLAGTQKWAARL
ncbi:hypothetical protein [Paeniglutamicibacter sp. Y32M11]|uniref:beta strand repeat-containing protein n=1 Tax=Paeniglutamicibacter sp. Y32M11 TaxID=2853258 RepID=UPI001C52B55A|nr:hypothetical protein [Paeniglutamicibacter sp. Y32M11]QXQ09675.1 hypothetical protein KUF55_14595 [Paeniglutamicibacter sp. Y32M11]